MHIDNVFVAESQRDYAMSAAPNHPPVPRSPKLPEQIVSYRLLQSRHAVMYGAGTELRWIGPVPNAIGVARYTMARDTKFKPGQSGNPETRFKPGNRHRWQAGQSGNATGIPRSRLQFEETFYTELIAQGTAQEAALLLWQGARAREPWAVQALLQRLAPHTQQINLTQEAADGQQIDYTRLTDAEIEQLENLLKRATTSTAEIAGREGPAQSEAVCDGSLDDSGTTN
jgi:hypothetical protein